MLPLQAMESTRQLKIARLLQKDLGEIFQVYAQSKFRGAIITVTKVRVTRDLGIARVFLSLFATTSKEELFEHIKGHTGEIKYQLGNRIRKQIKGVPDLEFFIDDSLDYIDNIDNLLNT